MKKYILPILALAMLGMVACGDQKKSADEKDSKEQTTEKEQAAGSLIDDILGEKSVADQVLDIFKDAIARVEDAESPEEILAVSNDMQKKAMELEAKYKDYEPTPEEEAAIMEASKELEKVATQKLAEFGTNMEELESLMDE